MLVCFRRYIRSTCKDFHLIAHALDSADEETLATQRGLVLRGLENDYDSAGVHERDHRQSSLATRKDSRDDEGSPSCLKPDKERSFKFERCRQYHQTATTMPEPC